MEYKFREVTRTDAGVEINLPDEGFQFGDFNSITAGYWLLDRNAPTPSEQSITETVPYMQGELDFSMLSEERFFRMREITYKLLLINRNYRSRSGYEEELKRQLMPLGYGQLHDTHDSAYYWNAKCKSVEFEDDAETNCLTATVTFTAYPFAYTNHDEGADYWDDVFFPHWIWQQVKFSVNGSQDVNVKNIGSRPVLSSFVVTGNVKAKGSFGEVSLNDSNYKQTQVVLDIGDNKINLSGNGTIEFVFKREEMV